MKIGVFGGTFDPVHFGHLLLAETCRQKLELTEVRFVPAGSPPHKADVKITDGHVRADMLQLAVSGYSEYTVDRRELRRRGPSFTVDTLTELTSEFSEAEFFFLMGADSLRDVPGWRSPDRITQLATVVAVNRPGLPMPTPAQVGEWVGSDLASRIQLVSMPGTDLSATELRRRVREGQGLRFMTPKAVEAYIDQHGIYAEQPGH
ncbi:MAG: nicotinate-nucleotide adenylyltransferase [Fuerstiella sp.]